ncbi:L,D-transpeptidase family protein [Fodinisporobacter ferrooxydans]|uniref:L,D-transpeptidase family protein n=1 Tax=Fodinisporobacter ferrooxydans TaxID=2901836 RepID=A0ABY4CIY2_9BACL|nr:L,D-transpeptidase family protein [Alicyclobacillaceae bacterium MYW30-H2]
MIRWFHWFFRKQMQHIFALCSILFISCLIPQEICHANTVGANFEEFYKPGNTSDFYIFVDTIRHRMIVKQNGVMIRTFPIAIGTDDTPSPIGEWKVISKSKDWGSGFGTRWLGLNVPWGIYGIHGTNKPQSIGRRASHGCVRMFNRDVEALFQMIPVGTPVTISGYILGAPWELPRRLVEGERGPDVLLIQQRLKYGGYYSGTCDGIYRGDLDYALQKFQKVNHISIDRNVSLADYRSLGLDE